MPTALTRTILFLSSYSPLFLILSVHLFKKHANSSIALSVIAIFSVLGLIVFMKVAQGIAPSKVTIRSVSSRDGDVMSYVATYILPFIVVNLDNPTDLFSFGLLLLVVAVLYVNSNLIHVNPILNLLCYHVYEIDDQHDKGSMLICKRRYLRKGDIIDAVSISDYVLIERT